MLFLRFHTCERQKRAQKCVEKRISEKQKPMHERKKSEFVLFPPSNTEAQCQSPKPLGRGKSKGLESDVLLLRLALKRLKKNARTSAGFAT